MALDGLGQIGHGLGGVEIPAGEEVCQFIAGPEVARFGEIFLTRRDEKLEDQIGFDVLRLGLLEGLADKLLYAIGGLICNGQRQAYGKSELFGTHGRGGRLDLFAGRTFIGGSKIARATKK